MIYEKYLKIPNFENHVKLNISFTMNFTLTFEYFLAQFYTVLIRYKLYICFGWKLNLLAVWKKSLMDIHHLMCINQRTEASNSICGKAFFSSYIATSMLLNYTYSTNRTVLKCVYRIRTWSQSVSSEDLKISIVFNGWCAYMCEYMYCWTTIFVLLTIIYVHSK